MSVAFRRESDEEHKEPRFELPIPPGPNLVTASGLHLIDNMLAGIETALSSYSDKDAREALLRDKRYWQTRQATAQLAPIPSGDDVAFGTRVKFRHKAKERTIDIVGTDEADPAAGRIAFMAPLARAIMGAAEGEFCAFAGDDQAIEILAIEVLEVRA